MQMIVKPYIKEFESYGLGMFVHFGIYSVLGAGEWAKFSLHIPGEEYEALARFFCPEKNWAEELVAAAKMAGCKYITITSRHHDGFSLYDTQGLSDFDAPSFCGRDLVREFVDACREGGIIPFFYHTLVDWHMPSYKENFRAYLSYLRSSVEKLCTNYGKIGGFWFDGTWDKPQADWEQDALYALIRTYQPEAMIINNTGMDAMGALGHIELDSVTFERGNPKPINLEGAPKYIASEMCQVMNSHWGYARKDLGYCSTNVIIQELASCRRCGANYLLNVGPMENGLLRTIDRGILEVLGQWVALNEEAIRTPRPTSIAIQDQPQDFLLKGADAWYLFVWDAPMYNNPNGDRTERFPFPAVVRSVFWLDNGVPLPFVQDGGNLSVTATAFSYGENLVVRVAKIVTE